MASRVQLSGPQEAEKYVLHMIEDGEIYASINQKDGMVCFHDNPEKYNNPAMLHKIDQEMLKCIELDEKLKSMDQEITVNPQFVQKSMGSQEDDVGSKTSSYSWEALDGERTLQPPNTFFPGWVGFFLKRKTNILLHKDIGQGKSNCVEWW